MSGTKVDPVYIPQKLSVWCIELWNQFFEVRHTRQAVAKRLCNAVNSINIATSDSTTTHIKNIPIRFDLP